MSRAKPGYTGDPQDFPLDTLGREERLGIVEKLKDFYPARLPDDWDDFTEQDLAACTSLPIPDDIRDPKERFCHYVYYSAAQVVAEYKGDEFAVVTPAQASAEVRDLCNSMKKVLRILPKRSTTELPRLDLETLDTKCRQASNSTIGAIYSVDEIELSHGRVDADLRYVSDTVELLIDNPSADGLSDLRILLGFFISDLESAVELNRAETLTFQPEEKRKRRAQARVRIAEQMAYVLNAYGLNVSTYHAAPGVEHDFHKWDGSSDLVQILCLLGKIFGIGGSGRTWSEVVRRM